MPRHHDDSSMPHLHTDGSCICSYECCNDEFGCICPDEDRNACDCIHLTPAKETNVILSEGSVTCTGCGIEVRGPEVFLLAWRTDHRCPALEQPTPPALTQLINRATMLKSGDSVLLTFNEEIVPEQFDVMVDFLNAHMPGVRWGFAEGVTTVTVLPSETPE